VQTARRRVHLTWVRSRDGEEAALSSGEEFEVVRGHPSRFRLRAYQAVSAVVSDDHDSDDHDVHRGVDAARAVADTVLVEAGPEGLAETVVQLSLKLAEALERIAADGGVTAADLADVWFVD